MTGTRTGEGSGEENPLPWRKAGRSPSENRGFPRSSVPVGQLAGAELTHIENMIMDSIQTIVIIITSALIGGFISYYFTQKTEKYKLLQLHRQKAESVARLFAKWIKYRGKENIILNKEEQFDYYEDLNQMSIEAALWISDEDLLKDVMARLENKPDAKSVHNLIGEVRKLILDNKKDGFDSNNVVIWPRQELLDELLKDN